MHQMQIQSKDNKWKQKYKKICNGAYMMTLLTCRCNAFRLVDRIISKVATTLVTSVDIVTHLVARRVCFTLVNVWHKNSFTFTHVYSVLIINRCESYYCRSVIMYRVGQIKWHHFTFLLVTHECIHKILWFLAHINYIMQKITWC